MSRGKAHAGGRLSRRPNSYQELPGKASRQAAADLHTRARSPPFVPTKARTDDHRDHIGSTDRRFPIGCCRLGRYRLDRYRLGCVQRPGSMTTAEATVATLVAHGLDTIYALPGVHNDALFDALFKASDRIRTVHSRHEQGAAYMALGAALATGRTQAYSVVPGPGLLNSSAALLTAYGTNAPVLALIGHIPQAAIGRMLGHLHEIRDQAGIIERLVDHYARIHTPAQAPGLVAAAIASMRSDRPGPVGLECAIDVWGMRAPVPPIGRPSPRRANAPRRGCDPLRRQAPGRRGPPADRRGGWRPRCSRRGHGALAPPAGSGPGLPARPRRARCPRSFERDAAAWP